MNGSTCAVFQNQSGESFFNYGLNGTHSDTEKTKHGAALNDTLQMLKNLNSIAQTNLYDDK